MAGYHYAKVVTLSLLGLTLNSRQGLVNFVLTKASDTVTIGRGDSN